MNENQRKLPGRGRAGGLPAETAPGRSAGPPAPYRPAPESEIGGLADLLRYWQIVRNEWRIVAGIWFLVVLAVAVGTFLQTPVYRATGMIEIRRQGSDIGPVEALFQSDRLTAQYLQTQYEILRSLALARRVVTGLDLVQPVVGEPQPEPEVALAAAANEFREALIIDPIGGTYLVRIQFEAPDPDRAAHVVNTLVEEYGRMRAEAGEAAVRRLEEQVARARAELGQTEARLNEYVRENSLSVVENVLGERENIPQERLRQLQHELTTAEADRYDRESRYNLVRLHGSDALNSDVLRSLSVRFAELSAEYARLSSTFTDGYPATRQVKRQMEDLEDQMRRERSRIANEIRDEYLAAQERQLLLQTALDEQQFEIEALSEKTAEYYVLQRDVEGQRQLFSTLQLKQKEAEVAAALATTDVDVLEHAVPPLKPVRPLPKRNLQLAMLVGLFLGVGGALLRDLTSDIGSILDEADSQSIPVLGMIPSIRGLDREGDAPSLGARGLLANPDSRTPAWSDAEPHPRALLSEAFGALRTSVLFDLPGQACRSLVITSTQPGEGKSTVSSNLAVSLTRLGRRVLLVDADLRRPALHRAFDVARDPGLTHALAGAEDWWTLRRVDVVPGLDLLTSGRPPANPSELLSSDLMGRLVMQAQAEYDLVIVDSPALMIQAADARLLARLVDGTIVVIRGGVTPRDQLRQSLKQVRNVIGVVLNDLDPQRHFPAWYYSYEASAEAAAVQVADV